MSAIGPGVAPTDTSWGICAAEGPDVAAPCASAPPAAPGTGAALSETRLSMLAKMQSASAPDRVSELEKHIAFFDRDGDGTLTFDDVKASFQDLGYGRAESYLAAHLFFDPLPTHDVHEIAKLSEARHPDSGAFKKDGTFDEAAFEKWFAQTDADGDGQVSRHELLVGTLRLTDSAKTFISSYVELQLMYTTLEAPGSIAESAVRDFFTGDFMAKIAAKRGQG